MDRLRVVGEFPGWVPGLYKVSTEAWQRALKKEQNVLKGEVVIGKVKRVWIKEHKAFCEIEINPEFVKEIREQLNY